MTNALDKLTAELVMGWPTIDFSQQAPKGGYIRAGAAYHGADHPRRCETFQPSTDPRDTFAVVDKLRAEGWKFSLVEQPDVWSCMFMTVEPTRVDVYKQHKDRLTAILLAALAVRGVSDEEVQAAIKEGA